MSHRPNQLENYALQEQYNPRTGNWLGETKDILLRFLQDVFYGMPAGEGCFHFVPGQAPGSTDEVNTEIIVTDAGSVNTSSVEQRPAIIVSRGPFAWGNTSLDQLLKKEAGLLAFKRVHTDLLSGSFVLNCVSRTGLEAENVALVAARAIRIYRRELQKAGFFHIGTLLQVGSETPAGALVQGDSSEDFVNVPVSFPAFYQDSWTVDRQGQLLNALSLRMEYVARHFSGSLLNPGAVDSEGNPLQGEDGVIIQSWTFEHEP